MAGYPESPLDRLWKEYGEAFQDFDDLTLARWMSQTLGQIQGRAWRLSHPLLGTYRLAAQLAHDRQIWLKRLANVPAAYPEAMCCRAPLLPLFTRDLADSGLVCQHCGEICVPFEDLPEELAADLRSWSDLYRPVHAVAHWQEDEQRRSGPYDRRLEEAAKEAEKLLAQAGTHLIPRFLEAYPAIVWEDQDECLEVRPEDVEM